MNKRAVMRAMSVAAPLLQDDERVVLATSAKVRRESRVKSAARQATTIAGSLALSSGMVGVFVTARFFYLVLTDRRLLILETSRLRQSRRPLLAEFPRVQLRAAPAPSLLYKTYRLTAANGTPMLRLSFPLPTRRDAPQLAKELGSPQS